MMLPDGASKERPWNMAPNSRHLPSGDKLSGLPERTSLRKLCKRRRIELEKMVFPGSQFMTKRRHSYEHLWKRCEDESWSPSLGKGLLPSCGLWPADSLQMSSLSLSLRICFLQDLVLPSVTTWVSGIHGFHLFLPGSSQWEDSLQVLQHQEAGNFNSSSGLQIEATALAATF